MNRPAINKKREYKYWILVTITFFFYIWLAYQIPYTHDDWDWGIYIGIQHLLTADINSRYAGNLIEVVLTRNPFVKTIVMGIVFTLIPLVSSELALLVLAPGEAKFNSEMYRIYAFSFANIIIFGIPSDVWRQTNGWVAGFSNFVVSGLAILLYFTVLVRIQYRDEKESSKNGIISCCAATLFGVLIQLFLENISVFLFMCTLLFIVYAKKRNQRNLYIALSLLVGTTMGLLIMFSSNIYQTLWNTGYAVGRYRKLMFDRNLPVYVFIIESIHRFIEDFIPGIVSHHGLLSCSVSILLLIKGLSNIKCRPQNIQVFLRLFIIGDVLYTVYYLISYFKGPLISSHRASVIADLLFVCLVSSELPLLFRKNTSLLYELYAVWIAPFLIMAPMVIINTVGPRSYYTTYVFLILFCQILIGTILRDIPRGGQRIIQIGILLLLFGFGKAIADIYYPIGIVNRQRFELIQKVKNEQGDSLRLPAFPNKEYLWISDPTNEQRKEYYRAFYGIPEGITLDFEK